MDHVKRCRRNRRDITHLWTRRDEAAHRALNTFRRDQGWNDWRSWTKSRLWHWAHWNYWRSYWR